MKTYLKSSTRRTNVPGYELTNAFFNTTQLKQRILMLQQPKTNRSALWRYAFIIPVIALPMLYLAACDEQTKPMLKDATPELVEKKVPVLAQPILVDGKVLDPDGKPLPGANVIVAAGNRGTTTDMDGNFKLNLPKGATGMIVASFIGFGEQQAIVDKDGTVIFKLNKADNAGTVTYKANKTQGINEKLQPALSEKGVYTVVENHPKFPGGMAELGKYINNNLVYPEAAKRAQVSGKVFVSFIVDKEGKISNVMILKGIGFGCDEAAIRLMLKMPHWEPGTQDGKPVNVRYNLPINFALSNDKSA